MKIELELSEKTYNFFKARACFKETNIDKEISKFLENEAQTLQECAFIDAIQI